MLNWEKKNQNYFNQMDSDNKEPTSQWINPASPPLTVSYQFTKCHHYGDPASQNRLIQGDNLFSLKLLCQEFEQKPPLERIKCIYIDPPYNTGNDFQSYNDKFDRVEYLNMLKPRLELLQHLLRPDGILFVHIDDYEHAYVEILLDEIFGIENHQGTIIWRRRQSQANLSRFVSTIHDYILIYTKDHAQWPQPPIKNLLWLEPTEFGYNQTASNEVAAYFGNKNAFDTPKPELLLYNILNRVTSPKDWVLDCFLGCGTTASVAHKMGRRWIGIEMMSESAELCRLRLEHVLQESAHHNPIGISKQIKWQGGGGFDYYQLTEVNHP
jgi:adenine-specific DNA-methyltransferase